MEITDVNSLEWFTPLIEQVRAELKRVLQEGPDQRPALRDEIASIDAMIKGWSESLAKPTLSPQVRAALETDFEAALAKRQQRERRVEDISHRVEQSEVQVEPADVLHRLNRLADVLASSNLTAANLELSMHIDRISCYSDGRVVQRTCKLGAIPEMAELLEQPTNGVQREPAAQPDSSCIPSKIRRRTRLRVNDLDRDEEELDAAVEYVADPGRFAGLPDEWFWVDHFAVPERESWAESHALEVAEYRLSHRASIAQTAAHFGKSPPTIGEALKFAKKQGVDATGKALQLPRGRQFVATRAKEVVAYKRDHGGTLEEIAAHFDVCVSTIQKSLRAEACPVTEGD